MRLPDLSRNASPSDCLGPFGQNSVVRPSRKLGAVPQASEITAVLALVGIALLLRLIVLWPIDAANTSETWDNYRYFERALILRESILDLIRGELPDKQRLWQAYSDHWPPGQPIILALGLTPIDGTVSNARLIMVALSVATVPLVYLLTRQLADHRAALFAAGLLAVFPGIVRYSIHLASETSYAFIASLALLAAVAILEATRLRRALALAAVAGLLLGLGTLTRAIGLAWVAAIAVWLVCFSVPKRSWRLPLATLFLVCAALPVLPWEVALYKAEQRFVLVATSGDENLYRGNNPWLPDGFGSWGEVTMPHMSQAGIQYSRQFDVSLKEAYRSLAIAEIRRDPGKFLIRGVDKLRDLWAPDYDFFYFPLIGAYPPMSPLLLTGLFLASIAGYVILGCLIVWGLLSVHPPLKDRRPLLLVMLSVMGLAFVSFGIPRFLVPVLVVLLPAAGHAAARIGSPRRGIAGSLAAAGTAALLLAASASGLAAQYTQLAAARPSSVYAGWIRIADGLLHRQPTTLSDRLLLRSTRDGTGEIVLSLNGTDFNFAETGTQRLTWPSGRQAAVANLVVRSATASVPVQVQVVRSATGKAERLSLGIDNWQRWQPLTDVGVEAMWVGSETFPIASTLGASIVGVTVANDDSWTALPGFD